MPLARKFNRTTVSAVLLVCFAFVGASNAEPIANSRPRVNNGSAPFVTPELVLVPGGTFIMGSSADELWRNPDEGQREVTISPFYVGKYEVTVAEWEACVADGGCKFAQRPMFSEAGGKDASAVEPPVSDEQRARKPMQEASWADARAYVQWLSTKTGQPFRLLTEAEWEYAARGGTTTPWISGATDKELDTVAWGKRNAAGVQVVGGRSANGFGLFDMIGNVWEWVEDCYQEDRAGLPASGAAFSPAECRFRVLRGGSVSNQSPEMRTAYRGYQSPNDVRAPIGFRIARSAGAKRSTAR